MGLNLCRGNRSFLKRSKLDIKYNFRKRIFGDTKNSCSNCKNRHSVNNIPNYFRCKLLKRRVYYTNLCDGLDIKKDKTYTKRIPVKKSNILNEIKKNDKIKKKNLKIH